MEIVSVLSLIVSMVAVVSSYAIVRYSKNIDFKIKKYEILLSMWIHKYSELLVCGNDIKNIFDTVPFAVINEEIKRIPSLLDNFHKNMSILDLFLQLHHQNQCQQYLASFLSTANNMYMIKTGKENQEFYHRNNCFRVDLNEPTPQVVYSSGREILDSRLRQIEGILSPLLIDEFAKSDTTSKNNKTTQLIKYKAKKLVQKVQKKYLLLNQKQCITLIPK